jgi:transcriptional regulator with XRE-family HTH domain
MVQANEKCIGSVIKEKRKKKNLTQKELAEKANISRNYLSDMENGRYMPSVKTLAILASILGFDLNIILHMTKIQDKGRRGA